MKSELPADNAGDLDQQSTGPASPCIRECCLDNQDICLGCHRSLEEILEWSDAALERKQEIIANCRVRGLEKHHF